MTLFLLWLAAVAAILAVNHRVSTRYRTMGARRAMIQNQLDFLAVVEEMHQWNAYTGDQHAPHGDRILSDTEQARLLREVGLTIEGD